ncbi:bcl-2-related ovarian killer protein isoform X3 [Carettochelys insculpta]|uniref:bcl-2-related ovarian killer protein isoform X3 n=1 Tax=Carettochelys insculpta TaxID=44489 RepID=UPI003EBE0AFB
MEVLRRSSVFAAEVMEVFDRSPTDKELVSQAKVLCRDYIHSRLLRAGIGWSKADHGAPVPGGRLAEVSSVLLRLGDELEYIRPNVYRNVARQLNISLHSETVVTDAFLAVAAQIFVAASPWLAGSGLQHVPLTSQSCQAGVPGTQPNVSTRAVWDGFSKLRTGRALPRAGKTVL